MKHNVSLEGGARQTGCMVAERTATDAGRVRQRNLAAVLQLVHHSRGVTRADLTRALGLNRSTIGDLVGALVEAGWVDEVDDAPREGVGRPSPRVVPRTDRLVAAINPELDAIEVALVALGGRVVAKRRVSVDSPTVEQAVSIAAQEVGELAHEHLGSRIVGAGVAVPGLVRRSDGVVRLAPHLDWREAPLARMLSTALSLPVEVANDAQLGCRAEFVFGAGADSSTLVYLNGGPSGIGGGIIIDGISVGGRDGHAGELGHVSIDPHGPVCACGARGCLEALVRREHLVGALGLSAATDTELQHALEVSTDPAVASLVQQQWHGVRVALRGIVNTLNPDRIILGGHLAMLWRALSYRDRDDAVAVALAAPASGVRIEVAALGAERLIIGAAELAWEASFADPLSS